MVHAEGVDPEEAEVIEASVVGQVADTEAEAPEETTSARDAEDESPQDGQQQLR